MAGEEAVLEYLVERMLDAGEGLGRIVILVVDVDISVLHGLANVLGQQALVHESLGGLGRELHHHTGRGVGIHIGVLPGDVGGLGLYDLLEDFAGLGLSGKVAFVAVSYISLGDLLARALHKLHLHEVLDVLDAKAGLFILGNLVGDFSRENYIPAASVRFHCFEYRIDYLAIIEIDGPSVSL